MANVTNAIRCMVREKGSAWVSFLQSTVFALNAAPLNADTLLSPYLLQYGRLPRFPCEATFQPHIEECETREQHLRLQHETFQQVHNVMKQAVARKRDADVKRKRTKMGPEKVKIGSIVFLRQPPRAAGSTDRRLKWQQVFQGPFCVISRTGNTVRLFNLVTENYTPIPINLTRIKHLQNLVPEIYFSQMDQTPDHREYHKASDIGSRLVKAL